MEVPTDTLFSSLHPLFQIQTIHKTHTKNLPEMQSDSLLPFLENSKQEEEEEDLQYLSEIFSSHDLNPQMGSWADGGVCFTPGYDLWCEGDFFEPPEPIMEEWGLEVEPTTAMGIPMVSCGEEAQCEDILREVFMDCEKDLFEMGAIEKPMDGRLEEVVLVPNDWEETMVGEQVLNEGIFSKSLSFGCLDSFEWCNNGEIDSFLNCSGFNFGDDYGMRRSFSEGDIKTLGNDNVSVVQSPRGENQCCSSEERLQKLSRYRNKKKKRNFGRKIKYACRKALADNQPRIRGRFAKTDGHHERHKKQHVHMITAVS